MSEIKVAKLVTGEELVVEIVSEDGEFIQVRNPILAVLQRTKTGEGALGFMPWMHAANGPFMIAKDKLICVADVAEEVRSGYNQIFGAGIVVPPQGLITG